MSGLSEAELQVQAIRLVCEASKDREEGGLSVDWSVVHQQLDQLDAILQDLQRKNNYDSSEIVDLRRDRDHWRQARQDAIAAGELMKAEIDSLRQQLRGAHAPAMSQQSEDIAYLRARLDEERSVIASLREQLAEAQQPDVDAMRAEIEHLRTFVGKVRAARDCYEWPKSWNRVEAAFVELDGHLAPVSETAEGET